MQYIIYNPYSTYQHLLQIYSLKYRELEIYSTRGNVIELFFAPDTAIKNRRQYKAPQLLEVHTLLHLAE